jgi:hypothetical protein
VGSRKIQNLVNAKTSTTGAVKVTMGRGFRFGSATKTAMFA